MQFSVPSPASLTRSDFSGDAFLTGILSVAIIHDSRRMSTYYLQPLADTRLEVELEGLG